MKGRLVHVYPFVVRVFRLFFRVHYLRSFDLENKELAVPAWFVDNLRVQELRVIL